MNDFCCESEHSFIHRVSSTELDSEFGSPVTAISEKGLNSRLTATTRPPSEGALDWMPSMEVLQNLRSEWLADDLPIDERMLTWTEERASLFFENGGEDQDVQVEAMPLSVFHVSDLHVEHKANLAWLDRLPDGMDPTHSVPAFMPGQPAPSSSAALPSGRALPGSVLLCCGDVATDPELLRHSLRAMRRAYETMFFVPGNHDVWMGRDGMTTDSLLKFRQLLSLCRQEGVRVAPERLGSADGPGVWIVPLASWYHAAWDREPPLRLPPGMSWAATPRQRHAASDNACCMTHADEQTEDEKRLRRGRSAGR